MKNPDIYQWGLPWKVLMRKRPQHCQEIFLISVEIISPVMYYHSMEMTSMSFRSIGKISVQWKCLFIQWKDLFAPEKYVLFIGNVLSVNLNTFRFNDNIILSFNGNIFSSMDISFRCMDISFSRQKY